MPDQKQQTLDRIYNIKGLSWMLKATSGTSSACSTNSSHIDQQFRIFKLKDQKKKWKKKTNKKFESVGQQIEATIMHKYTSKQPFDRNYKIEPNVKHTPHLRQVKSVLLLGSPVQEVGSKSFFVEKQFGESFDGEKVFLRKGGQGKENDVLEAGQQKSVSMYYDPSSNFHKKIFTLKKVFGQLRHEKQKVIKCKNILKLHSKQKQFIDKHNVQFFGRQHEWIDNKTEFYNRFDIADYEKQLIQKRCQENK